MMFRHKAFINIMKFVRDYIFECLHYSQDSNNPESSVNTQIYFIMLMKALCRNVIKSDSSEYIMLLIPMWTFFFLERLKITKSVL